MRKGEYKDISDQVFGRLKAVEYMGKNSNGRGAWRCICECGNETVVSVSELLNGGTKSCGCLRNEKSRERMTKHGLRYTRLYGIWLGMKKRISDPNCEGFQWYGGRGIGMCKEWWEDFTAFHDWAMNNGYADNLSIDRKNVNGDYCPDNCRWATAKEQALNRRPRK